MIKDQPESIEIFDRYTNPTRYDIAPYGSLVSVSREDGSMEMYIQTTSGEELSSWITIGELLSRSRCIDVESIGDALCHYSDMVELQKKKTKESLLIS